MRKLALALSFLALPGIAAEQAIQCQSNTKDAAGAAADQCSFGPASFNNAYAKANPTLFATLQRCGKDATFPILGSGDSCWQQAASQKDPGLGAAESAYLNGYSQIIGRKGKWLLIKNQGKTVRSFEDTGEIAYKIHSVLEKAPIVIIWHGEDDPHFKRIDYILVNHQSGNMISVPNWPNFSPTAQRFAVMTWDKVSERTKPLVPPAIPAKPVEIWDTTSFKKNWQTEQDGNLITWISDAEFVLSTHAMKVDRGVISREFKCAIDKTDLSCRPQNLPATP